MQAVRELGAILGIWAHPDDETYLSGGVMAAAAAAGQRVACVTATTGERGTDDPSRWPPQRLAGVRRGELAEALGILGVDDHIWLGYPDGDCAGVPADEAVGRLARIIDRFGPGTILTFGPEGITGHPDHVTVGAWARQGAATTTRDIRVLGAAKDPAWVEAFSDLNGRFDLFRRGYPKPVPRQQLAVHLRPSGGLVDRKALALRAQATQTAPLIEAFGADRWRDWIRLEAFRELQASLMDSPSGHIPATRPPQPRDKG